MVDPFGAAGLAVAALTLPAQVFSNCVLAYTTVSDIRTTGNQFNRLFWLFKVQHTRFLVWGQNSDIYRDGITPENLSPPVYDMIVSTLMQINDLLQDVAGLRKYYGLHQLPAPNTQEPQIATREIKRQATLVFQVQKSCSLFRKIKWAVQDGERFAGLVQQLTQFNDALYQFSPLLQRPSQTLAVDAEELALTIVNDGWQGVQSLRQAVSNGQVSPHSQLNSRAAAFISGAQFAAIENGINAANRPSAFVPARELFFHYHQVQMLNLPNDTPKRRTWGQFSASPGYSTTSLIIEWRPYNEMGTIGQVKNSLQARIEALVRMLQQDPKPTGFRTLDCLGYMEDTHSSRFGLIFRYPQTQSRTFSPLTLYQTIASGKAAYLGDRFQLAASLAESLYELHASRWLHKSVNSHNILFFQHLDPIVANSTAVAPPFSLANPYFTGFALSRPDDEVSMLIPPDPDVGIYRHPDVQGLAGKAIQPHHYIHDIYSLGALLLEIGTWCNLGVFLEQGQSGDAFRERLLNRKVPLLGISMGEKYMIAVRKCLSGRFDGMMQFEEHERNQPDYILNLQRSFYWEVVKVLKECRV